MARITGICALSPSKKNPRTISLGCNWTPVAQFAAPLPAVVGIKHCAQGKSSSGSSAAL